MTTTAPQHLLHQIVAVHRTITTVASDGSPQSTWQTHLAAVAARLRPITGKGRRRFRIYVGREHDIAEHDRIVHGALLLRVTDVLDHGPAAPITTLIAEEVHP